MTRKTEKSPLLAAPYGVTHEAARYGEDAKSGVTKQEAALFTTQEAEIAGIIVEHLGVEAHQVTREARFEKDLGADSLDLVELHMAFEDRFLIVIPDDEADAADTVGKVFDLIAGKKA